MQIRPLDQLDAPLYYAIRLEALTNEPGAFGRSAQEHETGGLDLAVRHLSPPHPVGFTLGAFDDAATLVGIATFSRNQTHKEGHKGHIYGVYVAPLARRRGVANRLISALLHKASRDESLEQILLTVSATQTAAQRLYAGFGFVTYGTEPRSLKVGDTYIDEHHMLLRLLSR